MESTENNKNKKKIKGKNVDDDDGGEISK